MASIAARIPDEIEREIAYLAREENTDKSKMMRALLSEAVKRRIMELALQKYSKREVSLGRAAELARVPLADFMKEAADRKIPMNYSLKSLEEDFKAVLKAK